MSIKGSPIIPLSFHISLYNDENNRMAESENALLDSPRQIFYLLMFESYYG